MAELVLRHISKWFGNRCVIDNLSLTIPDGTFAVLVGPSGCGKSTLLRLIAGLTPPTSGEILLGSRAITDLPPKDRDIAMVFQDYALYPHMSVFDNLAFGLKMRKLPKNEIKSRVEATARALGIEELLSRRSKELSGGQQQRVALGRALVRDPRLFLLDEPLSNLDAKLRVSTRAELIRLHRQLHATMLFVTHDQAEAMSLGELLVVMHQGRILQTGPPLEVYREPADLFVAGFLGVPAMNTIRCTLQEEAHGLLLIHEAFKIPLPAARGVGLKQALANGRDLILGLRPEHLQILPQGSAEALTSTALTMETEFIESLGSEQLVTLRKGDLVLSARVPPDIRLEPGGACRLRFVLEQASFFDPATGKRIP